MLSVTERHRLRCRGTVERAGMLLPAGVAGSDSEILKRLIRVILPVCPNQA
jgi:hypothetical protein